MVKISVNRFVSRRVEKVRKEVEVSTQKLRKKTLKHLEEISRTSARVAKDEIRKHVHFHIDTGASTTTLLDKDTYYLGINTRNLKSVIPEAVYKEITAKEHDKLIFDKLE